MLAYSKKSISVIGMVLENANNEHILHYCGFQCARFVHIAPTIIMIRIVFTHVCGALLVNQTQSSLVHIPTTSHLVARPLDR